MPRIEGDVRITPSVLDRLIDDEPQVSSEPPMSRPKSLRQLKDAVRRDLEWLLNTRRDPQSSPEGAEELERSLYNYGLPDTTTFGLHSVADQNRLLRLIEATVSVFEPRIAHPRVTLEPMAGHERRLRFRIEGLLRIDPAPEKVTFDTVLELPSGQYEVRSE